MSKLRIPVSEQDHQIGNANAEIQIVEYGDYQCPYCGAAHPLVKKFLKQHGKDVLFIFRNFPLQESHPFAFAAALAAEAANLQGKFWEMHDLLYEKQNYLSNEMIVECAEVLKLDIRQFEKEINSSALSDRIENDFEGGVRSGVNGTPSFFVNGIKWNGYDESYESFLSLIQQ